MSDISEKVNTTVEFINEKTNIRPEIGLVLGSGLGNLAEEIENPIIIPYSVIPHFVSSTVHGHKGRLIIGNLEGKVVICMQGRLHFYEGYSLQEITYPIRVMQKLGISKLLVTNAAGGINRTFVPGDLMLIYDHINLFGANPLIGENVDSFGCRFPDMSQPYSKRLREIALKVTNSININIKKGIYAGVTGPSYETPAEIRFLEKIGADAVGMSTVPEVIIANHGGIEVLGISLITNMAAGILDKKLVHSEVIDIAKKAKEKFIFLTRKVIKAT